MGWRFRHSFKIIPGVRLNLSKSGLSCSVGGAPLTLNVGPRGAYATASLPGSGISYRQRLAGTPDHVPSPEPFPAPLVSPNSLPSTPLLVPTPIPALRPVPNAAPIEEVRSASTELLTSESLKELKRVMQMAHEERQDIEGQLGAARQEKQQTLALYSSWESGFLLKRLFKKKFLQRKLNLETAEAKVAELEEQLRLTIIAAHIEVAKEQAEPYFRMRDEFAGLSECAAIWDIKTHQATDRFRERTIAGMRLGRERVNFSLGNCDLLQWEQKAPHLQNAKGGELFLFPGFILYRAAREAFSVIDFHDVRGTASFVNFHEEEGVPKDSTVVGNTWAKANKDGGPDRRFANNFQIPIVRYGSLVLKSETGLWEEFLFSNPQRLERFLTSLNAFGLSFMSGAKDSAPYQNDCSDRRA